MSEASPTQPPKLTNAQKDAARRLLMSEKEYAANAAELIKRGKILPENIR